MKILQSNGQGEIKKRTNKKKYNMMVRVGTYWYCSAINYVLLIFLKQKFNSSTYIEYFADMQMLLFSIGISQKDWWCEI